MAVKITYFVHGTTTDNERDLATGWSPGELSQLGISQAKELGWSSDYPTILVHTLDYPAETRFDGKAFVREGVGEHEAVVNTYSDIVNYYTMFAFNDGKVSQGAVVATSTDKLIPQKSNSYQYVLGLIILLLVVWLIGRSKKGRKKKHKAKRVIP